MRLLLKWSDGCGVQYVQREAALGTASLYGDIEAHAKTMAIAEAAKSLASSGRTWSSSPIVLSTFTMRRARSLSTTRIGALWAAMSPSADIEEHYDYNARTMLSPVNEDFNFDFSFSNYIHVLYKKDDFIKLEADAVHGIKSWRFTQGSTSERVAARGGHGVGGLGYAFRSQPHVCFCEGAPCKHIDFTGAPSAHCVHACFQEKTDREQATAFVDTIKKGMPLASKGDIEDKTSGGEPLWLSIAEGTIKKNTEGAFKDASGRTINMNWAFVDVTYLNKIKTASNGDVHYEAWTQPQGARTVLTKPKILTVSFELEKVEKRDGTIRYVMEAGMYQRLTDAVKPHGN